MLAKPALEFADGHPVDTRRPPIPKDALVCAVQFSGRITSSIRSTQGSVPGTAP